MALQIVTRNVLGRDVDFVVISGDEVIPRNNLSPLDFKTLEAIEEFAGEQEPEITLAAALNVFVLKNGRIASSIFGPMVVDIDDYVGRLGRAGSFNNIHNTVATLVEDVADLKERVAVLED